MDFEEIARNIDSYSGQFICHQIGNETEIKTVALKHTSTSTLEEEVIDAIKFGFNHIPGLLLFYSKWGSLRLYHDLISGDCAFYIAPPNEWRILDGSFRDWIELLDEEEEELLPKWIKDSITIGEVPESGNYLLMCLKGKLTGSIFKFDHDGLEFKKIADNLSHFLEIISHLDTKSLTEIASHMSFIDGDPMVQWWIKELRDNRGNVIKTAA